VGGLVKHMATNNVLLNQRVYSFFTIFYWIYDYVMNDFMKNINCCNQIILVGIVAGQQQPRVQEQQRQPFFPIQTQPQPQFQIQSQPHPAALPQPPAIENWNWITTPRKDKKAQQECIHTFSFFIIFLFMSNGNSFLKSLISFRSC
jgi:hypothetical protein